MELTCAQMDVLLSFYIEEELSKALKKQVEEHLEKCPSCRAKFDIIKTMLADLKTTYNIENKDANLNKTREDYHAATSEHYRVFQNNLSAYLDNELTSEESIKLKKFTINNKTARKDLEDCYNIRRLMNDSFKKTKLDTKQDFSKSILRQMELEEEATSGFHPAIKLLILFTITVLVLTSIVLISLSV